MVNDKRKGTRTFVAQSTHYTSFGVCAALPLSDFNPPVELKLAVRNFPATGLKNRELCYNYIKLINDLQDIKRIEPQHYLILFKIFLYLEDIELQLLAAKHNLKDQTLIKVSDMFQIIVPTLNEDDKFINVNDRVRLYVIESKRSYFCKITDIVGKTIYVSPSTEAARNYLCKRKVDVCFLAPNWPIKCCHYVLHVMFKYNLVHLIYPKIDTNLYTLPKDDLDWVHKSVSENPEQKTAVINIVNSSAYPAPYILFGPPGTGKTTTLVEAICQIRKQYKSKSILVCASSNAAADEIAKRLLRLLSHKDILRMYAPSKHYDSINKEINPCSNFVDNMVLYLPREIFISKKIVITTLITCIRLVTLKLRNNHFSHIFIDEASQATEVESLIPLAVINSKNETKRSLHAQIVIAGDPHQLGPIIRCQKIEHLLGKSLLERLMECEPYQKVNNKYNPRYITKLIRNYRSQPAILHTSNKLFYDNELLCCKSNVDSITSGWTVLLNRKFPIIFFVVKGDETRTANMSVYNEKEVTVTTECIMKLMNSKFANRKILQNDIGIVTPFKQQKLMVEKSLNKHKLKHITVGTVETFQGQEKEIILFTTVRSQIFEHDNKKHIGFLSNPKRFNVAMTRAKNLLIIVGNPFVLCQNKHWNTLLEYCKINNAYNMDYANI